MALSGCSRTALISGSPALSMKTAPLRPRMTENPWETRIAVRVGSPGIIESAGDLDFAIGPRTL